MKLNLSKRQSYVLSNIISSLLPFLVLPYLARMIPAEQFGIYAIYFGVVTIFGSIINLSINNTYFREPLDKRKKELVFLNLMVVCILSLIFIVLSFIMTMILQFEILKIHFFVIFISVCFVGFSNAFHSYFLSIEKYSTLIIIKYFSVIVSTLSQLIFVYFYANSEGLIYSNLVGLLFNSLIFTYFGYNNIRMIKRLKIIAILKKNIDLIKFTSCSSLINNISNYTPEFLLAFFFGAEKVGLYNMAVRIIAMPLGFISSSIQDIFKERISVKKNKKEYFIRFSISLFLFAVVCLILTFSLIDPALSIVLGDDWVEAGLIIKVIISLVLIKFINGPLSFVWILKAKEKYDFIWQFIYVLLVPFSFIFSDYIGLDFINTLIFYVIVISLHYVFAIVFSYRFIDEK